MLQEKARTPKPQNMNNSIYKRRRSAAAITSEETKIKAMEENYDIALFVFIDGAEGLDYPSMYPNVSKRIYNVVFWVQPEQVYCTQLARGLVPIWKHEKLFPLGKPGEFRGFLNLEVVRHFSKSDPGTSNGQVVVGRAQIPLPWNLYKKKSGRYGLVRLDGSVLKAEGRVSLSMQLKKIRRNSY